MPTLALTGAAGPPFFGVCAALEWEWPATDAKYWITFLVFSVLPAPDSPLQKILSSSLFNYQNVFVEISSQTPRFTQVPHIKSSWISSNHFGVLVNALCPLGTIGWETRLFLDSNDQQTGDAFAWVSKIELLVPQRPFQAWHGHVLFSEGFYSNSQPAFQILLRMTKFFEPYRRTVFTSVLNVWTFNKFGRFGRNYKSLISCPQKGT